MAENLLKNESIQEEQNKKKSWKPYAAALGILLIGAGTGLGVYYGLHTHHSEITKINLNTLINKNISGTEELMQDTTGQMALKIFLDNNANHSDLENNIEITSWDAPTYKLAGKLILAAKANSKKYTGTITVTLSAIDQTNLTDLRDIKWEIQGTENMDITDAFNSFVTITYPQLANNVTLSDKNQNQPTWTEDGSFDIIATPDGKYSGTKTITINAIGQINLKDLNLDTSAITGTENMQANDALKIFLDNNANYSDLKNNIEVNSFTPSTYTSEGKLVINAKENSKYTGNIEITITVNDKIELSSVITTTEINGKINQNQVIETVLNANSNSGVSSNDLKLTAFTSTTVDVSGSAIIEAVDSSKFIGSVNIKIILFPEDAELKAILNKLKSTPPSTLAAIEIWKEYFAYYSQEKIQYMINTINTKYTVNKSDDTDTKQLRLREQILNNTSKLLHQVIAGKDGLADIRYDNFNIDNNVVKFDEINNVITVDVILVFIWNAQNDITEDIVLTETRTININFSAV